MATRLPLIVIVGPTASGKTGLAIELARRFNGEIICADSRTVYEGMDIGTAKPDKLEQAGVPHWGLGIAKPSERFTAAQFQTYVKDKIAEIRKRGRVPFLVGGTGLYIDSVIFDYGFPRPLDSTERAQFETLSREDLYEYCIKHNIELPEDDKNKRRLIRAIADPELSYRKNHGPVDDTIIVGIATEKSTLEQRIEARTEHMFKHGVVEEATKLGKKYGWDAEAMTSNVYRSIRPFLEGTSEIDIVKAEFIARDRQLAKRQMTWFRRNPYIEWCNLEDALDYISRTLSV